MTPKQPDLICFSHLRWDFVFQRPQHLMSRFAKSRRVFFIEEPMFEDTAAATLRHHKCETTGVEVCAPILPIGVPPNQSFAAQQQLLENLVAERQICEFVAWYYTPMAREFTRRMDPTVVVYDCMDELSAFQGAPPELRENELELFEQADLVFTGGATLYEAKRKQHAHVYCFPSSVDVAHFRQARSIVNAPKDQENIPEPRLGYAGVIDERMDISLLREIAAMRPNWHFVIIGPIAKIDPALLPKSPNMHYLGMKSYKDLPAYFSGWRIGMLPFALNESTRYISPTKTPEYLAAGLRVISTPIRDVVTPYGDLNLAGIASGLSDFVRIADQYLLGPQDRSFEERADAFLAKSSWDQTWLEMNHLVNASFGEKRLGSGSAALLNDSRGEQVHV